MKNLSFASVAGLVLFAAASANAADIRPAYKAPPPVVAPAPLTWTGFYFGGHIGGAWGWKTWTEPAGSGEFTGLPDAQGAVTGFLGGIQAGFNLQLSPNWVGGVEADVSWGNIKGAFPCFDGLHAAIGEASADYCSAKSNTLGTIVGRFGPTVGNAWVYLLGGGAWIRDRYQDIYIFDEACQGVVCAVYNAKETRWGWTAGGGIEYAVTANWSGKLQYNYMDFGTRQLRLQGPTSGGICPCGYPEDINQRIHTVKIGINYRFGWWGAPVRASY